MYVVQGSWYIGIWKTYMLNFKINIETNIMYD